MNNSQFPRVVLVIMAIIAASLSSCESGDARGEKAAMEILKYRNPDSQFTGKEKELYDSIYKSGYTDALSSYKLSKAFPEPFSNFASERERGWYDKGYREAEEKVKSSLAAGLSSADIVKAISSIMIEQYQNPMGK